MKYLPILFLLTLLIFTQPAHASNCRLVNDQKICIVEIKRSAKNFWEYRASVSVNGIVTPIENYNCRSRVKLQNDGTTLPFEQEKAGDLICSFFKS